MGPLTITKGVKARLFKSRTIKMPRHTLKNFMHTALLLGGMILMLGLLGYLLGGMTGIIWAIVLGLIFIVFSPQLSPKIIFKMNKARELSVYEAPGLYQIVQKLAQRANLPASPTLYYIPGRMMNAFTVGDREDAAIGITEGLLQHLSVRQLTSILAHEISHIRNNDIWVMKLADAISRLTGLFSLFGQFLLLLNLPLLLFGGAIISWEAILLLIFAPTLSGLLQLALSRTREFEADLGAARLTGDPGGLALALERLEFYQGSLFERMITPGHRLPRTTIFRTHPKTEDRVERLLAMAKEKHSGKDLISTPYGDSGEKTNSITLVE